MLFRELVEARLTLRALSSCDTLRAQGTSCSRPRSRRCGAVRRERSTSGGAERRAGDEWCSCFANQTSDSGLGELLSWPAQKHRRCLRGTSDRGLLAAAPRDVLAQRLTALERSLGERAGVSIGCVTISIALSATSLAKLPD
jgi:hypothetical protein